MTIGTNLRKLRDIKRLSTRHLADIAGIPASTYMDWEHDKSSPTIRSYIKLAEALEVCPVDLMAYLLGRSSELMSGQDKDTLADMKEMLKYYKGYSDCLKNDILRLESELLALRDTWKE